jgi:tetratricopeptide (TPR) repeat protein
MKYNHLNLNTMSNYLAEQYFIEVTELIDSCRYTDAKKKLDEIIEMEPGYGRAHYMMGWIYFYQLADYEKANYHLRLAMQLAPEYPVTYYTLAYLLNEINHPVAMQKHAAKALAVRGVDASIIYNQLAKSMELSGNYPKAIENYLMAQRLSLCNHQMTDIDKSLERVKSKMKTFDGRAVVYDISE